MKPRSEFEHLASVSSGGVMAPKVGQPDAANFGTASDFRAAARRPMPRRPSHASNQIVEPRLRLDELDALVDIKSRLQSLEDAVRANSRVIEAILAYVQKSKELVHGGFVESAEFSVRVRFKSSASRDKFILSIDERGQTPYLLEEGKSVVFSKRDAEKVIAAAKGFAGSVAFENVQSLARKPKSHTERLREIDRLIGLRL